MRFRHGLILAPVSEAIRRPAVSNVLEGAMRHHAWVSERRHPLLAPPFTLGWTQFGIILLVIAAVIVLTGVVVLPF